MSRHIYLLDGENLRTLKAADYDSEDVLQELIAENPVLLDGGLINPEAPRRWLLIRREMPVVNDESRGQWSLDHLLLDQDGVPTLVEVKRACDTRSRREVVAQMLDYAANAVKFWPVEIIRQAYEERCEADELDPMEHLANQLGTVADSEAYWKQVKTNLIAGRIRMLFLADIISPDLRRIIEFLNKQMDPAEVLGLEVRQFAGADGIRTYVPHVVGQTSESEQRKSASGGPSQQWTEETFMERMLDFNGEQTTAVAQQLMDWARTNGLRIWFGRGKQNASFVPVLDPGDTQHMPFAVYTGYVEGGATVEIYFQWYRNRPVFDDPAKRQEMLRRMNEIPGITMPPDAIERRPNIHLALLAVPARLQQFLGVMDWYLTKIKGN